MHVDALAHVHRCRCCSSSLSLLGCQQASAPHTTATYISSSIVLAAGRPCSGCRICSQIRKRSHRLTHAHACVAQVQAIRDDHAKQRHAWASARRTLQAQQSSLQDECNDLACQLAERDQQLRARDERISYLKKLLEEANLAVTSRHNSEVYCVS